MTDPAEVRFCAFAMFVAGATLALVPIAQHAVDPFRTIEWAIVHAGAAGVACAPLLLTLARQPRVDPP